MVENVQERSKEDGLLSQINSVTLAGNHGSTYLLSGLTDELMVDLSGDPSSAVCYYPTCVLAVGSGAACR